jgi:cytochrome c-type biogenesis protein CcmH/NrfG
MKLAVLLMLSMAALPAAAHAQAADSTHHDSVTSARWLAKGQAYEKSGHADSARAAYEKALMYDADNIDATVKMATILIVEGHGKYATDLLSFALRRHPTDPRLTHFHVIRPGADTTNAVVTSGP